MIENQKNIPKDQWRYGLRSSAATGCGWIATYNALAMMGYRVEPEKLIRYYESQLPGIHGNLGTSLWAPAVYFRHWGFSVRMTARRQTFDRVVKESDAAILFYRWRKKWKIGAHFVAVNHGDTGFYGYNTYTNSRGADQYGESLSDFLKRKGYFGAVLIGIGDRRKR